MALRAGYYGIKRFLRNKLETIAGTYDETIKSLFPRSEHAVLGAKNRIGILFSRLKAQNTTGTWTDNTYEKDDVTFECTVDSAGYVTNIRVNGTASSGSAQIDYDLGYSVSNGSYKLNGAPVGGGSLQSANWFLGLYKTNTGSGNNLAYDFGDGADVNLNFSEPLPNLYIRMGVLNGKTITNGDFKPMLSFDGGEYVPYAMTNKELTNSAADQKTAINAIITAATGAADFAAFKTAMGAITPVTRSLSLTKEDITEEVKEDVEPEKTVTKKRTTKKTEEV